MARNRVAAGTGAIIGGSGTPGMVDTGLCRLDTLVNMVSREARALHCQIVIYVFLQKSSKTI